jgi:hypothetical protein
MANNNIILGPLLGVESNKLYTFCILLVEEYSKDALKLHISSLLPDTNIISYESVTQVHGHFFYRFSFDINNNNDASLEVKYHFSVDNSQLSNVYDSMEWSFLVPSIHSIPSIVCMSCNGSSESYPTALPINSFNLWNKLAVFNKTAIVSERNHLMIMNGDQLYADSMVDKVPIFKAKQISIEKRAKLDTILSDFEILQFEKELDDFYFQLYIDSWSHSDMNWCLASIPSIMNWDDHDIIDGYGSYDDKFMLSNMVLLSIFKVAKKYYELFQIRTSANTSIINAAVDYSYAFGFRNFQIIALDNRSHRTPFAIMNDDQKDSFITTLTNLKPIDNPEYSLILLVPIPVAHLDYSAAKENWIIKYFSDLSDDIIDHWDHKNHINERNELLKTLFNKNFLGKLKYFILLSGDVHSAGRAVVKYKDFTINQLISSAMVHRPVPTILAAILELISHSNTIHGDFSSILKHFGTARIRNINANNYGVLYFNKGMKFKLFIDSILWDTSEEDSNLTSLAKYANSHTLPSNNNDRFYSNIIYIGKLIKGIILLDIPRLFKFIQKRFIK